LLIVLERKRPEWIFRQEESPGGAEERDFQESPDAQKGKA
jgi:hypothetical protein